MAELTTERRQDLVKYRLERAWATLEEASYNAAGGYYNIAVNRLYYSAYYAASALMVAYSLSASSHAGIKSMLSLYFVRPGYLAKEHGKTFLTLFENRQSGDYEDFVVCDLSLYEQLVPKTKAFIQAIIHILDESGSNIQV